MRRLAFWVLFCCLITVNISDAQDQIYSQFFAAPIQLNPAFAGTTLAPRISLNYRNQWPSISQAYVTMAASYEQFFEPINSSIGIMVQTDNAGDGIYRQSDFLGVYGYRVQVNRNYFLKFGVELGLTQTNLDWSKLIFPDQLDPVTGISYETVENPNASLSTTYYDVGAGMLFYGQNFYAGVGLKHLNTPNESLLESENGLVVGRPMRLSLHAGGQIVIQEGNQKQAGSFISPNIMLIRQGDQGQINAGAYVGYSSFFTGLWYRHAWSNSDAMIFLVGFQYDIFKIGYSFDYTISGLQSGSNGTGGANELTLSINLENSKSFNKRRRSSKYNDCFKIFR